MQWLSRRLGCCCAWFSHPGQPVVDCTQASVSGDMSHTMASCHGMQPRAVMPWTASPHALSSPSTKTPLPSLPLFARCVPLLLPRTVCRPAAALQTPEDVVKTDLSAEETHSAEVSRVPASQPFSSRQVACLTSQQRMSPSLLACDSCSAECAHPALRQLQCLWQAHRQAARCDKQQVGQLSTCQRISVAAGFTTCVLSTCLT